MKKIITLVLLSSFVLATFGYTTTDVSQANYLASKKIIKDWGGEPKNYRFDDYIARSEIMGMVLAMTNVTRNTVCRGDFADVPKSDTDWVCRTIETASDKGYINAQKTKEKSQRKARPYDSITRAEALGILMKSIKDDGGWAGYSYYWSSSLPEDDSTTGYKDIYPFGAEWQASVFYSYIKKILQDDKELYINPRANDRATRHEVFDFAYKILMKKGGILEKNSEDERYVKYDGKIQVSGTYKPHALNDSIGCFYVDSATAYLIPRDPNMFGQGNGDMRSTWFCFENTDEAKITLDISSCNNGTATIEISNYIVDKLESEVFDTAVLQKVISRDPACK